ncbi:MAG: MmcB family DNA repair protein [Rhodospirillales bacterium]|nr:MmcB family DNA repair protein [Rhodospirillales bacterium]
MPDERPLSPTAQYIARGLCRYLIQAGYSPLTELILPNGRRVDVIAIDRAGTIVVVEIKSSVEDFRSDQKWQDYLPYCDQFYFAVAESFPTVLIPETCGLYVADAYGAAMLRDVVHTPVAAARRRALLLRFATVAAERLRLTLDPPTPTVLPGIGALGGGNPGGGTNAPGA